MTLPSMSYHDPVNANVLCCDYFFLFFDTHDKTSYPWRFKCNSAMDQVQLLAGDPRTGHMTSSYITTWQATKTLTSITPDRIELEPCARCHCVCLVTTHRLIWTMTYLGHSSCQVVWTDLRPNFQIDLSEQNACVSKGPDARNAMLFAFFFTFLGSSVICKT